MKKLTLIAAQQMIDKFYPLVRAHNPRQRLEDARQCALVHVQGKIDLIEKLNTSINPKNNEEFLFHLKQQQKIKQELEKL